MQIVQVSDTLVHISLSRRNVETLLKMVDGNVGEPTLNRTVEGGVALVVTVQSDEDHYAGRPEHHKIPGPSVEKILRAVTIANEDRPVLPRPAMLGDEDDEDNY
jgi:hypothetical protein